MLDSDLLAYVLRLLGMARLDVETITARDGDRPTAWNNQIGAAFTALLIHYAEGNRGGPKHFSRAAELPNINSAAERLQFLSGGL